MSPSSSHALSATASERLQHEKDSYRQMANAIRILSMDAVEKAKSGHPGMPLGMADVATVLFRDFLKFDATDPQWPDRDRFVLSAGHGSMLLYSLLHLTGYEDATLDEIKRFRQLHAKTAGHPEYGYLAGIETTTGPLGQGIATAVGMALAERHVAARFGDELSDHHTYVIAGDGCLMEGISQEAITFAGHLALNKLIVLFDDNGISIDGPTSLTTSEDQLGRFESAGWDVQAIDGHDVEAIHNAIHQARESDKPSLIACRTTIAFGAPTKSGSSSSHGAPLGAEEIAGTRKALGWDDATPFEVPSEVVSLWREAGQRNQAIAKDWYDRLSASEQRDEFTRLQEATLPENWRDAIYAIKKKFSDEKIACATRQSSGYVLEALGDAIPELLGGSADLTGSNNTKTKAQQPVTKDDFSGNYIYYGIREHAMAAAMNGIALHKGAIPYGGTFMVFSDYCRPAIRLSALMEQRVVYVMTHDSIGLGEDGPTHQPVEHLAALRAMPGVQVFRPADAVETAECWELALENEHVPSIMVLTRQGLPTLRTTHTEENQARKGAYILAEADHELDVTLFATGSEVSLAMQARDVLQEEKIGVRVVSVPCWELLDQQDADHSVSLLCNSSVKVGIEAASSFGWKRFTGPHGIFIGMEGFGASAPASDLYQHFGITVDNVVEKVKEKLKKD